MTEKSAWPIWANFIILEVANPEIAHRLIIELTNIQPLLRQMVANSKNRTIPKQSEAGAKRQLSRIRRQASTLRESLLSIRNTAEMNFTRQWVRIAAENEIETGNSTDGSWEPLSSLTGELQKVIDVLDASTEELSPSPGYPRDILRDFVIRCVSLSFRRMAPDTELSSKPTSLFYRVVDQYLSDIPVESQNLNRSLKRLIADGALY